MPTLDWLTRREDEQTAGCGRYRLLDRVSEFFDPQLEHIE
jgi:hypothetical protein